MQGTIEGERAAAAREVLRRVLASGQVDAVLVPLRHPAGNAVTAALVKDPGLLDAADPFAPVLAVNGARLVSMLTQKAPRPRLAAVLRNCEIRALIELVKLQQASMEGLLLIGVDCLGTYEVADYARIVAGEPAERFALRQACAMCEYPAPAMAPIVLQRFGGGDELWVEASDGWGERLGLRPVPAGAGSAHERAVAALIGEHTIVRDRILGEMAATTGDPAGMAALFSTCIRCHNCMTNCPICYCKTCFFKTDVFDHDPMQFVLWAERKGATRLPPDTVLFHLTRMNHMSTSCVGCGLCTSACPAGIPVGAAFRAVAARTQAVFGYVAGRSLEETPPVKTFAVDELKNLGDS